MKRILLAFANGVQIRGPYFGNQSGIDDKFIFESIMREVQMQPNGESSAFWIFPGESAGPDFIEVYAKDGQIQLCNSFGIKFITSEEGNQISKNMKKNRKTCNINNSYMNDREARDSLLKLCNSSKKTNSLSVLVYPNEQIIPIKSISQLDGSLLIEVELSLSDVVEFSVPEPQSEMLFDFQTQKDQDD